MATKGASGRPFRGEDSYIAERITRGMVQPFLEQKGYTNVVDTRVRYGNNESQLVSAVDHTGQPVKMHVQSCWRRDGRNTRERLYSAAQLMAAIKDGDWEGSIRDMLARSAGQGVTHSLLVQREGAQFLFAARLPLDAVLPIWTLQRAISDKLIKGGLVGRQTKNHAANGHSPTIYLQDDRTPAAHEVPDALWNFKGVIDLIELPDAHALTEGVDDTFDDCVVDHEQLGADGAPRVPVVRSMVKRDRRVRAEVLKRAEGACEREGCKDSRDWPGFLDVHHILGADKSDRVWNCVALCPSCHREAHFAPDHDVINAELLEYASTFRQAAVA
jgi:5-methylcytosine-specific restriction protein A